MKKIFMIFIGLIILISTIYTVNAKSNERLLKNLDLEDVNKITIESLPPGTKTVIDDEKQIIKITNFINNLKLKKDTAKNADGVSFRVYVNEDEEFLLSILGDQLLYNNKWYNIGQKAYDKFETLISNQSNP